jgi:hypothetical protein
MVQQKRKPKAASKKTQRTPRRKPPPKGQKKAASRASPSLGPTGAKKKQAARVFRAEPGAREKPPGRPEQRQAFFADARHATDALAEELGEGFVLNATSGEDTEEYYEREREEEEGGPFLETSARTEFAYGIDESNPEDAEPAPWPAVSPGQPPPHRPGGPR